MKERKQKESGSGYDRIIKYTGIFGGVQMLSNLITLVKGKLVAWLIGPAGMGIANVFNRALDLVGKTTDLGISFSAVKTIAESKESDTDSTRLSDSLLVVRSWSLWLGIIGTIATFFWHRSLAVGASTATIATRSRSGSCRSWLALLLLPTEKELS